MIDNEIERGRHAAALLDNPLLSEILDGLKDGYVKAWLASRPDEIEARERLYLASQVVEEFAKELRIAVENGQIAKAIIKRRERGS